MNFSEFSSLNMNGRLDYLCNRVNGIEITLPQWLASKAKRHALIRKNNHKFHNKCDFNKNADEIGLFGECIFGLNYNMEVDWSIKKRDDQDFKIGNIFIDVKSTEYGSYMTCKSYRFHPEPNWLYVFCPCRLKYNDGKIVGWLTGTEMEELGELDPNKGTPYWKVPFTKLHDISTIKL